MTYIIARALHQILEWKYHGIHWPSTRHTTDGLLYKIIKRINEASVLAALLN